MFARKISGTNSDTWFVGVRSAKRYGRKPFRVNPPIFPKSLPVFRVDSLIPISADMRKDRAVRSGANKIGPNPDRGSLNATAMVRKFVGFRETKDGTFVPRYVRGIFNRDTGEFVISKKHKESETEANTDTLRVSLPASKGSSTKRMFSATSTIVYTTEDIRYILTNPARYYACVSLAVAHLRNVYIRQNNSKGKLINRKAMPDFEQQAITALGNLYRSGISARYRHTGLPMFGLVCIEARRARGLDRRQTIGTKRTEANHKAYTRRIKRIDVSRFRTTCNPEPIREISQGTIIPGLRNKLLYTLSDNERTVLDLVGRGIGTAVIAAHMGITRRRVEQIRADLIETIRADDNDM